MEYPRYITKNWIPYDVVEVTQATKAIVCRDIGDVEYRKYTDFYVAGVYRGIVTGCLVGCNLRCFFCWSPPSRDFPERYGEFYSPKQVVEYMEYLGKRYGIKKARLSCGEPTICWNHLLEVIKLIEESKWFELFILETNGIVIGLNPSLVKDLTRFTKLYVRISLKGGFRKGFEWRTGARGEALDLQYRAIEALRDSGIRFHVAAMTDPRIMSLEERREIIKRLWSIDPRLALSLEEEVIDPYRTTIKRLEYAGIDISWK
ncbi:MAG TPA: radical SAM protein [Ignisphaera sp.]|nr:radical SAM protein [Ignisphaera sp.]